MFSMCHVTANCNGPIDIYIYLQNKNFSCALLEANIFFLLNKNKVISDMWIIRSNFFYLSAQVRLLETCDGCVQQNWLYQN